MYSTDGIDELTKVADEIRDIVKITSWDDRKDPVKLCFSVMKGHLMPKSTRIITSRQTLNNLFLYNSTSLHFPITLSYSFLNNSL